MSNSKFGSQNQTGRSGFDLNAHVESASPFLLRLCSNMDTVNHSTTNSSSGEDPAGNTFSFGTLPTIPNFSNTPNMPNPNFANNTMFPMFQTPLNYPPYSSYNNPSPHSPQATPQFNWTLQQKLMEQVESMTHLGNSIQESNISLMCPARNWNSKKFSILLPATQVTLYWILSSAVQWDSGN